MTNSDREGYIANCISRILMAPLHLSQFDERSRLIARGVENAARNGLDSAHSYFITLTESAERGQFEVQRQTARPLR